MAIKDPRRSVFVRMPEKTHRKLLKLVAAKLKSGAAATKQGVVIELIEQAPEPRR